MTTNDVLFGGAVSEITAKRLGLLHEFLPKAARIALLMNPGNPSSRETVPQPVHRGDAADSGWPLSL
jgi:hypothetical protein